MAGCDAARLASEMRRAGVCCLLDVGRSELVYGGLRVRILGKGHASVVVAAALVGGGIVAVKIRRTDSKRQSLEMEAHMLEEASRAGASPRPIYYARDFIVMEFVGVESLERLLSYAPANVIVDLVIQVLRAARALDAVEVLHQELNRPLRNVFFPGWPNSLIARIIDLESASRGCGNVNKVVGFLVSRGLINKDRHVMELLRSYKSSGCQRSLYNDIEKEIARGLKVKLLNGLA
ncbi:MAG: hypothetical protein ACP5FT_03135 [Acidilobus sp.]